MLCVCCEIIPFATCAIISGKLQGLASTVAGRNVYLRFNCFAGDAMGMNMVSKGVLAVIDLLQKVRAGRRPCCGGDFDNGYCKWESIISL